MGDMKKLLTYHILKLIKISIIFIFILFKIPVKVIKYNCCPIGITHTVADSSRDFISNYIKAFHIKIMPMM